MQLKKINLVAPSSYQEKLCSLFSAEVYITNKDMYSSRNQNNEDKVKSDIYFGKMAEFAVYNYLLSINRKCSTPDIMIYQAKQKSYDADLIVNDSVPLHVKSCINSPTYGNSWVFQPNDSLVNSPNENETIALVVMEYNLTFSGYIVKATDVIDLYKPPRKAELNKKVLYEKDLIA